MANNSFDDLWGDSVGDILDVIGVSAVYTPSVGAAVDCVVFFDEESMSEPGDYMSGTWVQRKTIEGLLSVLGQEPNAGDTFVIGANTYTVTTNEPENDGYTVKVTVK